MAVVSSNNYKVQPHNHVLTSILSAYQSQVQNRSKDSDGVDFGDISVKFGETLKYFHNSDSLYQDLCLIEKQIENEANERIKLEGKKASNSQFGFVMIKDNGGLLIDESDGALKADFSSLQSKLVDTGVNRNLKMLKLFGTDNRISLLSTPDDNDDIVIITNERLESHLSGYNLELTSKINELNKQLSNVIRNQQNNTSSIDALYGTISGISNQIVSVLNDIQQYSFGTISSNASSGSSGGSIVCPKGTTSADNCENVVITANKQYYRKLVKVPLDSCVESSDDNTKYFMFDDSQINTTDAEYMVLKFDLDMEFVKGGSCPDPLRLPWIWIDSDGRRLYSDNDKWENLSDADKSKLVAIFDPEQITNVVVEIRGYYKCQRWEYFGKLVHQYYINCEDTTEDDN